MLSRALETVSEVRGIIELVLAVPPRAETRAREEARRIGAGLPVKILAGGAERQDSVRLALMLTSAESELVVVHDAARPFARAELFVRCLEAAERTGGAIAAVAVADTLKRVADGAIVATVARSGLWQAQTPQAFQRRLLIEAHERAVRDGFNGTDDAELVERIGGRVEVVEGSPANIKITTPSDLEMAQAVAALFDGS
jgi:2-C-methyl-D-erythritol 4-phosphate cytidylyltransferase